MANPLIAIFNPITTLIDQIPSVSAGPTAPGIPVVTNLNGVVDSSLLGVGSLALAGETIAAGQLVNIYSQSGSLHAQVAHAEAVGTAPSGSPYPVAAQGFANSNTVVGGQLTINFSGTFIYIDGHTEFNASSIGSEVYLSAITPGGITLTAPSGPGQLEEAVGYVVGFTAPNTVTVSFVAGFQDFTHISGVNPISKGGTGATSGSAALINLIAGSPSTGQALIWNGSAWVPGTDVTTFAQITTGTNTTATMTVSTGASLTTSGTGTINANQLTGDTVNTSGRTVGQALVWSGSAWMPSSAAVTSFTDLTTGTNTTATMTVGTGASLTFSPTGVINANQLYNVVISNVAPSVGQSLTATGASAADWETIVAAGTANQIAFYSASGHSVSGDTLLTDNGTTLSYTGTGGISSAHLIATTDLVIAGGTALTTSNQTGTGSIVLATGPTISGATLSGTITTSGTETYTTANPTFFSATGTGAVVLANTPTLITPVLGVASATSLTTSSFVSVGTTITSYNGVSTVSNGVGSIIAQYDATAQTAAIAGASLIASTPAAGQYRVSWSATVTTASSGTSKLGGNNGFQLTYTDVDTTASTSTPTANPPGNGQNNAYAQTNYDNVIGTQVSGVVVINATSGSAVTISFDYASTGGTVMVYAIHAKAEYLGS